MKTYVIQHRKNEKTIIDICQSNSIIETINFLSKKYENGIGHIEYIYSENEEENEENTHITR